MVAVCGELGLVHKIRVAVVGVLIRFLASMISSEHQLSNTYSLRVQTGTSPRNATSITVSSVLLGAPSLRECFQTSLLNNIVHSQPHPNAFHIMGSALPGKKSHWTLSYDNFAII